MPHKKEKFRFRVLETGDSNIGWPIDIMAKKNDRIWTEIFKQFFLNLQQPNYINMFKPSPSESTVLLIYELSTTLHQTGIE
jgi:hypothetical protein